MEFSAPIETASLAKFSSKGQHVAHLHNNSLLVRESDGMRPVITAPCSEPLNRVEWSPNGELVFGVSARRPAVSVRSNRRGSLVVLTWRVDLVCFSASGHRNN